MPTEAELREQFHERGERADDGSGRLSAHDAIDLDAVLRRSRARRRPRVAVVAVVSSLAALAIIVPVGVSVAGGQTGTFSTSSGSAASAPDVKAPESLGGSGTADGGVSGLAPAQKVNLCTGSPAELPPAANGLVLTVAPVDAAASDRGIPATVTLTNTGSSTFSGSASPFPALTLSRAGIVIWHSNGAVPSLAQVIELAPGASVSFSTTFDPVVCGVADDERTTFRSDLPSAGPGTYGLSAVLAVSTNDGGSVVVGGPVAAVTLR
ncbi:hypothetical protein BH10ACT6_BH10ACT6_03160 [soil metagenome]